MSATKKTRTQQVYTQIFQVGRKEGDGLPEGSSGGGLLCFASGVDEDEAVRETVKLLKNADLAPLDVTGYGTLKDREAQGHDIGIEERELMDRALSENAVIIAEMTPFFDNAEP